MNIINQKVLVSGADYFSADAPINPYYGEQIDVARAIAEHERIIEAYKKAGIEVIQVPPPANCQDGVYTANWGLCRGQKCVLSNLPNARKLEEPYAEAVLTKLGKTTIKLPDGLKFSGQGDSLPCGKYLLAGSCYRSDKEAQRLVAEAMDLELVQLHAIPQVDKSGNPIINKSSGWADSLFYDIDLAISVLREDLIAYCPDALDEESRIKIANLPMEKIKVSYEEAVKGFACNLVSTGETVIMSCHAPNLKNEIEKQGLKTILVDAPELAKGGGFIRCISLTL